ncbi:MAG: hypothetical protein LBS31_03265 [Candidatus Adiutrix sp.]|jgi:hypothetical protein|nr:hypothetical protein [Candidatus Adiutrix sp.]
MTGEQLSAGESGPPAGPRLDHECVPFWEIFQNTRVLLTDNTAFVLNYALLAAAADFISGRLAFMFGKENQLIGLMLISFLIFAPVLHMAASRLALRFWDNEKPSWADLAYGLANYGDSLFIFLSWLIFCVFLGFLLVLCAMPALVVHAKALEASGSVFFAILVRLGVLGGLLTVFVWPRARRILPFLHHIIAFNKIDGRSGPWLARTITVYRAFNETRFNLSLNQALGVYLGLNMAVAVPLVLVMHMSGLNDSPAMSSAVEVVAPIIGSGVSSVLFLWMATAAAGFYRLNRPAAGAADGIWN